MSGIGIDRKSVLGALVSCALLAGLAFAGSADAATGWWQLNAVSPVGLQSGGSDTLTIYAVNLGNAEIDGSSSPVKLIDKLPANLNATSASGRAGVLGLRGQLSCALPSSTVVECTFEGQLQPYEPVVVEIGVKAEVGAQEHETGEVTIAGGEALGSLVREASSVQRVTVGGQSGEFGVENYEMLAANEDGSPDAQAGSHPFGLTTTLMLNRTITEPFQPEVPKDLTFRLPPGLVGNPTPFPQCSDEQFEPGKELGENFVNHCPNDTTVGVVTVIIRLHEGESNVPLPITVPLFNLHPSPGEPARFGFVALGVPVTLDTSVRTGEEYGVTVTVHNITELASFYGSEVTFWGVPGAAGHAASRGWLCVDDGFWGLFAKGDEPCATNTPTNPPPLLSLPTSCTGTLGTSVQADSYGREGAWTEPFETTLPALSGCNRLPFEASISVTPASEHGSTPTGLTVGIHVPQTSSLNPNGLAQSDVRDTVVTLPEGVVLNPSAADGLMSCSEAQVGLSDDRAVSCPEASKVGLVRIKTPLLPNELTGAAYLAAQDANPFGSLVALYVVAEDPVSGTLVKVAGEVKLDPVTGQLVSTFDNTPQLPFEDFELEFFGGDRAPLSTPASCGSYTTQASFTPWSGNDPVRSSSTFDVSSGPNGSPCASPLPFAPSLTGGTTSIQAGGFSPFTMTVSREDGEQNIGALQLHMPPGLSGLLTGVELCGEAQADAGSCGVGSLIGETTVGVGLGSDPYSVTGGKVYITGPYEGAPFGISVVVPAKAGPYDLGQVVVRGKIEVNPITSALTVTTDSSGPYAIPHILDGIPLAIRHVNFVTTRPGFTFNPTNCNPMSVTGSISSVEGSTSAVSVPFQVTNCATLAFKPGFAVSTSGKTSRKEGASLHVKLTYPKAPFGSQANIRSVKVDLPKQLPSRLETLQRACPAATFQANPAACSAASRIGTAKATTPLIPVPLEGPVYFVSHAGEQFPELIIVLSGYGVTVDLHSETFINSKTGITSSTFRTIPDVPVGTFELTLPEGPYSALAAPGGLCKGVSLKMPTAFTAQNGAVIHQNTPIAVTGCPKHKSSPARKNRRKSRPARKKGRK